MGNSNKLVKPAKPYLDYPLYAHRSRRWAKKMRGETHDLGQWDDPRASLACYLDQKDESYRPSGCQGQGAPIG